MPRAPRIDIPGGLHHVYARGNRREPIFVCEADFLLFLGILARVVEKFGWRIYTYCLMPNHYHLLVKTPEANLSCGMHSLNSRFAHAFNDRYGLSGHVFEARFKAVLVESQEHLLELVPYIVLNPVRAGLCVEPGEWQWSSHRALAGQAPAPPWLAVDELLALFGPERARARDRLARLVRDAAARPRPPRPARAPRPVARSP